MKDQAPDRHDDAPLTTSKDGDALVKLGDRIPNRRVPVSLGLRSPSIGPVSSFSPSGVIASGLMNKLVVAATGVVSPAILAEQHRKMAEPGGA